jgi:hypothetical protein
MNQSKPWYSDHLRTLAQAAVLSGDDFVVTRATARYNSFVLDYCGYLPTPGPYSRYTEVDGDWIEFQCILPTFYVKCIEHKKWGCDAPTCQPEMDIRLDKLAKEFRKRIQ